MQRWRLMFVVATTSMLLAACGGASAHATTRPSTVPASTAGTSAPSASGCGHPLTAGSQTSTITVGGRARTLVVHVPDDYTDSRAVPLVLNLHGSGSNAAQQELLTGMDATADAHDFVVVYPQAAIPSGAGFVWNIPGVPLIGGSAVPAGAANDEAFLEHVVSVMRERACIDPTRVYATGFSGGARMSSQLACDASTTFAAVAPVSGLRLPTPCPAERAVPVISFHGRQDPVDPYNGHGQQYWTYSVPTAAQRWAAHDGCSPAPRTSTLAGGATLTAYTACRTDSAVDLYTLDEGHEWPGGPKLPSRLTRTLGPQTDAVNADTAMWEFFAAHPMP
jgi:polyhydroxybutyrate depolymerase